ncbi:MAG: glycosyl transferase [Jiangellaceae bacterium]
MPHLIYIAIGFPPAAKSSAYRMRATANLFCEAGWDVTVVTIHDEGWEREFGVDASLSAGVDPRIRVVKLPLSREDLDPDIRAYGEHRARNPKEWLAELRRRELDSFPEPVFGLWRAPLEKGVAQIHDEKAADLVLVSPAPNAGMAAAWKLWSDRGVPYAVDYRDAWSLDTYQGTERFTSDSPAGQWESKIVKNARELWCVNSAIADFYRARYASVGDRIRAVQNGFDRFPVPVSARRPDAGRGLTFGFVGTANFPADMLTPLVDGWRTARAVNPILGRSRLVFRGHFGAGMARGATRHVAVIEAGADDSVGYEGPVLKADLGEVYSQFDALVLLLPGGRYVTAGKTYEYVATGHPIMSVHSLEHGAAAVLQGYPLWTPPPEVLSADALAESFSRTARMALDPDENLRAEARAYAAQFERRALLMPAVKALAGSLGASGVAAEVTR